MGKIYNDYAFGLPSGIKVGAQLPLDIRTVVDSVAALTDNSTWRSGSAILSYKGMTVAVVDETNNINEVYLCLTNLYPSNLATDWKKISAPDIDISGKIIDVVHYDGDASHEAGYYDKSDGTIIEGSWVPNEGAAPLNDPDGNIKSEGKYLQLELKPNDYVYIKTTDLIDLDGYVTEEELNSSINNFYDTSIDPEFNSINELIEDISTYIYDVIDTSISIHDTSIVNLIENVNNVSSLIEDISTYIYDVIDTSISIHDTSIVELIDDVSIIKDLLETGVVNAVVTDDSSKFIEIDPSRGVVNVSLNIVDATNSSFQEIENNGLATTGYVEEKLDKFNWVEIEEEPVI